MAVDVARRPYTTTARFFRNSPLEIKVKWLPADPARGTFPGVSRICSLDWVTHPETAEGVGEVFNTPRNYNGAKPFEQIEGNHFCGTLDEHRNGEVLDPTRPEQKYHPSGLPLCCDGERREASGGPMLKSAAHYTYSNPSPSSGGPMLKGATHTIRSNPYPSVGGSKLLASSTHTIRSDPFRASGGPKLKGATSSGATEYHAEGGPKLKGLTYYTESTVCPAWAETCALAPLGWVDHECARQIGPFGDGAPSYPSGWRVWELEKNTDYKWYWRFELDVGVDGGWKLSLGTACSARVLLAEGGFGGLAGAHVTFNSGDNDRLFAFLEDVHPLVDGDSIILATETL